MQFGETLTDPTDSIPPPAWVRLYEVIRFVPIATKLEGVPSLSDFASNKPDSFISLSACNHPSLIGNLQVMSSCFQAKREMTGGAPRGSRWIFWALRVTNHAESGQRWLYQGVTGYMKWSSLYLPKRGCDGITSCFLYLFEACIYRRFTLYYFMSVIIIIIVTL